MTTKDKLLHIAAQLDQLNRELEAIGKPVSVGGAPDISMSASHAIGIVRYHVVDAGRKLSKLAGSLS